LWNNFLAATAFSFKISSTAFVARVLRIDQIHAKFTSARQFSAHRYAGEAYIEIYSPLSHL